jgi:hypothetical protein
MNESSFLDPLLRMPVQIFAGIYAFVRGLDNFVTSVRE